jgi:hypothetical protein
MTAESMRNHAENCLALAEQATTEPTRRRYMRMAMAWQDLAEHQDWLDGLDGALDKSSQHQVQNAA